MTDEAASKGFGATIAYLMYPSLQTGATSVPPCSDSPLAMDDAALVAVADGQQHLPDDARLTDLRHPRVAC